jgi:hypothetical protein
MVNGFVTLLTPLIVLVSLAITLAATYRLLFQKTSAYNQVRKILIFVYFTSIVLISLEFLRVGVPSHQEIALYTMANNTISYPDSVLIAFAAVAIYLRPPDASLRQMLSGIVKNVRYFAFLVGFADYVVLLLVTLYVFRPFNTVSRVDVWGVTILGPSFSTYYVALQIPILIVYTLCVLPLVLLAARRSSDAVVRQSLRILAACWTAIGFGYFLAGAYGSFFGIDLTALMYLFFSIIFAVSTTSFNRASVLAGLLRPNSEQTQPFFLGDLSREVGVSDDFFVGKKVLLEFDPTSPYEKTVNEFATEALSKRYNVLVFTARSRTVYGMLKGAAGVKFFLSSSDVSYLKVTDRPNEVLIPEANTPVILDVLAKAIQPGDGDQDIAVIFDSLTDMLMTSGFEETYRFVRDVNEILSTPGAMVLFLVTSGAHDPKIINVLRSLFPYHISVAAAGAILSRAS